MQNTIDFAPQIAQELNLAAHHAANVIRLLDEGATIPFIARYRKEMTGTMNEENVAAVQKRLEQLIELQKRKESVIASINEQEKLTPELEQKILNAKTLQEVEDLYLPYKPKRRTRAAIAREKGLEPLAAQIMAQNVDVVERLANRYVNAQKGVNDVEEALQGAKDIMAEWVSENINGRNRIARSSTCRETSAPPSSKAKKRRARPTNSISTSANPFHKLLLTDCWRCSGLKRKVW